MKSKIPRCMMRLMLFVVLAISVGLAQDNIHKSTKHHRYMFIDLGTLGGPHSHGSVNGDGFQLLNNSGVVASYADLALPDPNAAFGCYVLPECTQAHAAQWKDGVITDLGALPVNNNSAAGSINSRGWSTGQSQTAILDPALGILEFHAVLWKHGQIIDLGTLDSGTESLGIYVNDAGQVVGFSTINTNPDPVGFAGFPTHTFIWDGEKLDIGTLGGANAFPGVSCSNQPEDLVVGGSTTTTTVNPSTGLPDADPFLWHKGKMIDLGTLGGTNGFAQCANRRHQVIGMSSVTANPAACDFPAFNSPGPGCHAFFWEGGVIKDLGTLGGDNSEAIWLNEDGDVVGSADLAGPTGNQTHDAVLWRNGTIHDLGTLPGDPCSRGRGLNSRGHVVGTSTDCVNALHAFVWEEGGPMLDLNTLIAPGSGFQLTNAFNINDRGEILAKAAPLGFTPNDDADLGHLALLIPCDDDHPNVEGCDYSMVETATTQTSVSVRRAPVASQLTTDSSHLGAASRWRNLLKQRSQMPSQRPVAHD